MTIKEKAFPELEVIVGAMFSGKSDEIDRRLYIIDKVNETAKPEVNRTYKILQPSTNTRDKSYLKSRRGANRPAKSVDISSETKYPYTVLTKSGEEKSIIYGELFRQCLYDNFYRLPDIVVIDEGQFFPERFKEDINLLLDCGVNVIIAGLSVDYKLEPFESIMPWALCLADKITKLSAVCPICGHDASFAQILYTGDGEVPEMSSNIIIDGDQSTLKYEPRCRKHLIKGIIKYERG